MPRIHLIPGLSAILVIARHHDGEVRVLANADEPWREIFNWAGRCCPAMSAGRCWPHSAPSRRQLSSCQDANT